MASYIHLEHVAERAVHPCADGVRAGLQAVGVFRRERERESPVVMLQTIQH